MGRAERYKDIQLPQLRSFCLAATEGNFTAAAKVLGLSAPTVWQQVRALERRLHTTLLRRRGRAVELTPEGHMLLELVQPHVSGLDSIEPLFMSRQALLPRQLTVAAIPYLTSAHLLRPVREFSALQPDVRLRLHVCVWFDDVARMVEQGQADLGVIFFDRDGPRSAHLDYERLMDLQLSLLTPADHPLVKKKRVTAHDLVEHPLIVPPEGSFARRSLEHLLQRHNLRDRLHVVMETALLEIIRRYVAGGIGIALLHVAAEDEPVANVHVRPFEARRESICVALIARKGAHLPEHACVFQRILRQCLGTQDQGAHV